MNFPYFFKLQVPAYLINLTADAQPLWGSMNASDMLEHLRKALLVSTQSIKVEIISPEEKIPALQAWLKKDKPMMRHAPKPEFLSLIKDGGGDFDQLKLALVDAVNFTVKFYDNNPDYISTHPNFGVLNTELWMYMHKKHIVHHFTQFGLIPEQ